MLKHKWGKRIVGIFGMMLVLMLLISTLSVTVFAAETAPVVTANASNDGGNFWTMVLGIVSGVLLIVCITLIYLLKTHKDAYMTKIEELQYKYSKLGKLQKETKSNLGYAEEELAAYEDWQAKALQIDPQIQVKINNIRNQQLADQFVCEYLQFDLAERTTVETYVILERVMAAYENLDPNVKTMVNCDMNHWMQKYQSATEDYIKEANGYLVQVQNECKATTKDLSRLHEAIKYYEALPRVIKASVPKLLIGRIREKAASAEMHLPAPKGEGGHSGVKNFLDPVGDDEDCED